jgi:hypothetical protein
MTQSVGNNGGGGGGDDDDIMTSILNILIYLISSTSLSRPIMVGVLCLENFRIPL